MNYFVKFDRDWADEFSAVGYNILDDEGIAEMNNWLEKDGGFYFGTNEGFEEGEIKLSDFTITPISDDEATLLRNLLGIRSYGIGQFPSFDVWED